MNETGHDRSDDAARTDGGAAGRRELVLMEWGGRRFALFAEEVECTAEGRAPTPLPHAPPSVLGVVGARGRMRTVLDAAALLAPVEEDAPKSETGGRAGGAATGAAPRFCVALRGDEQLALAAERVGRVEVGAGEIRFDAEPRGVARGTFMTDALEVVLLDASRLFEAAVRGAERRRRR